MKKLMIVIVGIVLALSFLCPTSLQAQDKEIKPSVFHLPISDFTLPLYQGGEMSISELKGKNVLIVFPRGHVKDNETWCNICQYQYADAVDLVENRNIRDMYNMEVIFILPYSKDVIADWINTMPSQMAEIEEWKFPADTSTLSDGMRRWMHLARVMLPKTFTYEDGKVPVPVPILMDSDQKVSKGLDLFRTEWSNSTCDQNIPAIIILDKDGVVQYKYISQSTIDRPDSEYLLKFVETFISDR